jgi:hypothetical protein
MADENIGGTPGNGETSPFGNSEGSGASGPGDATIPGDLKGQTPGESHESEGGKWATLPGAPNPGGAGDTSRFNPGSAT